MFGKSPKLIDSISSLVAPGEQVLAAIAAQPKGAGNARAVGGLAGAVIGGRGSKETRESMAETGIEVPQWAALAVTGQRLLILQMNAMGSKAERIASSIDITDVEGLDVEKSMLRKQITLRARGGTFQFETHKAAPAEELRDALARGRR